MGSPEFAVPTLHALVGAGHTVAAVYCQPPRPAGRGQAVRRCPVHVEADALGLPVRTPDRLKRDAEAHAAFAALALDAAVVAAYGLILPQPMLDAPRRGCLNIHASLLPRWRGAAPIQAAILAGDAASGVTIMQMEAGLDTGPILLAETVPLGPRATASELHDALAPLGARLIVHALKEDPAPRAQPAEGATYAPKLSREDGRIDWSRDAASIDRQVRALNPWPGTFTALAGTALAGAALKVLDCVPAEAGGSPGTVLDHCLTVACGQGSVRLLRVQAPGGAAMDAAAYLRGHDLPPGTLLGE